MKLKLVISFLLVSLFMDATYAQNITTATNGLNKPTTTSVGLGGTLTGSTTIDLGSSFTLSVIKSSSNYLTVINNGNVGIGIASPTAKLHVSGTGLFTGTVTVGGFVFATSAGSGKLFTSDASGNGTWQSPTFWSIGGNTNGAVKNFGSTDNYDIPFITNNTERIRITASGNFGIGTTSPSAQLHTTGSVRFTGLTSDSTQLHLLVSDNNGNLFYRTVSSLTTSGIGTVNNIVTGYGLSGGTITTNGTIAADTSKLIPFTDTLKTGGVATQSFVKSQGYLKSAVTNIGMGYGLSGSAITSTGTLVADTTKLIPYTDTLKSGGIATQSYVNGLGFLKTAFYQTTQNSSTSLTQRNRLNFGSEFNVVDNAGNNSTDISLNTIPYSKLTGMPTGNNGLSFDGSNFGLGQTVGASGDPSQLTANREIVTNGYGLSIIDRGSRPNNAYLLSVTGGGLTVSGNLELPNMKAPNNIWSGGTAAITTRGNLLINLGGLNSVGSFFAGLYAGNACFNASNTLNSATGIGYNALNQCTYGNAIVAVGTGTLYSLTSGFNVTSLGQAVNLYSTTLSDGVYIGTTAGYNITNSNENVIIGYSAAGASDNIGTGGPVSVSGSVVVGSRALQAQSTSAFTDVILLGRDNKKATNSGTLQNTIILGTAINTDLNNIVFVGANDQNTLIGASKTGQTDNGKKLQVYGTGFFSDTLTATTLGLSDSSNRVASTAWVKQQNFKSSGGSSSINGTANYVTKFTSPTAVGNSLLFDNGTAIGIGTTNPQSLLAVNGTITSTKVKVTQTGWSDYVFDSTYSLPRLNEVEKYIQQNKHLPDIPSAKDVETNGIDLGTNQSLLLKKIEELTLYSIQQNKEIEKLKEQNKQLQQQAQKLKELEDKLNQLLSKQN